MKYQINVYRNGELLKSEETDVFKYESFLFRIRCMMHFEFMREDEDEEPIEGCEYWVRRHGYFAEEVDKDGKPLHQVFFKMHLYKRTYLNVIIVQSRVL